MSPLIRRVRLTPQDNLETRLAIEPAPSIYTYCGQICIAVNPYRALPGLYSPEVSGRYRRAAFADNEPHIFAVAEAAFAQARAPPPAPRPSAPRHRSLPAAA